MTKDPHPLNIREQLARERGLIQRAAAGEFGEQEQETAIKLLDVMAAAVKYVVDAVLDSGLFPPPVPADPRKRALHLRKHRNTGPNQKESLDGRRRK